MVKQFQFARLPIIHFGNGKLSMLPGLIKRFGTKIILVTGKRSFNDSVQSTILFESFAVMRIMFYRVVISGEPSPESVDNAVNEFRDKDVSAVVGIGGGSVLDAGKAISSMMYLNSTVRTFLEGVGTMEHPGTKMPFIAVPTTSGTGSEATKNAVLSEIGMNGFKKSLRHDNFVPDIALVDPELTFNCPPDITAASGMDCFTQLTEAFLSDKSNEYTDALVWEGIRAIKSSLVKSFINGDDPDGRSGMSFAALTSGIGLANAGLGVVHGFASSIGSMYNIPHGVICGTLMAPANAVTVRILRKNRNNPVALQKYIRLGKLFLKVKGKPDNYYIDGFLDFLQQLGDDLHLPSLSRYGVDKKDVEEICRITELKNNPVKLNNDELAEILNSRI